MKKPITTATAVTLLLAAPIAAFAGDRGHGGRGWGPPQAQGWKHSHWQHGHWQHGHWQRAPRVYYQSAPVFVPAPRVVVPQPVFVPAPVVAVPAPHPYPYPSGPVGNVSIGFRFFF
jgi:hypothetical protein